MRAVDVNRAGRADAVTDECRPLDGRGLLPEFHQLGDCVCMQEAHVGSLDLPRLVLAIARKLRQIDREERPVDQAVYQMIDELAEHENGRVVLAKEGVEARENVLGARSPYVQVLSDFRQVGERVPREMGVAFDTSCCKIPVCDAENPADVDQHPTAPL